MISVSLGKVIVGEDIYQSFYRSFDVCLKRCIVFKGNGVKKITMISLPLSIKRRENWSLTLAA